MTDKSQFKSQENNVKAAVKSQIKIKAGPESYVKPQLKTGNSRQGAIKEYKSYVKRDKSQLLSQIRQVLDKKSKKFCDRFKENSILI